MTHPYSTPDYAEAFAGMGQGQRVKALTNWLFLRPIPGTAVSDARGLYPFSPMTQPISKDRLHASLAELGAVSLVLVTDALDPNTDWLASVFELARPYKNHHIIEREASPVQFSKHHRQEIRKANRVCQTNIIELADHLDDWCSLYDTLVLRHNLSGVHCFSRTYFETLAALPQFTTIAAFIDGRMVSAHIWLKYKDHVYSHLAASSEEGYRKSASYAVYDRAISHFAECRYINLGSSPDTAQSATGLDDFKRGFANQTRTNWICGTIVDAQLYDELCRINGTDPGGEPYFPSYRGPARSG